MSLGDRDGGSSVETGVDFLANEKNGKPSQQDASLKNEERERLAADLLERSLDVVSPRIERDDLLRVEPRGLRREVERRVGVGVVGLMVRIESIEGNGESFVDGVRSRVGTGKKERVNTIQKGRRGKSEERRDAWARRTHPMAFRTFSDEGCLEATTGPLEAASGAPQVRGTGLIPT